MDREQVARPCESRTSTLETKTDHAYIEHIMRERAGIGPAHGCNYHSAPTRRSRVERLGVCRTKASHGYAYYPDIRPIDFFVSLRKEGISGTLGHKRIIADRRPCRRGRIGFGHRAINRTALISVSVLSSLLQHRALLRARGLFAR
jgi:hypothetical protein